VITGKYNPGDRLPVDVPRSAGHLPAYHYQQNGCRQNVDLPNAMVLNGYMDQPTTIRLPFGFGLSYTQFGYSDFKMEINKEEEIPVLHIRAAVKNIGGTAGDEAASVIRPQQELLGFKRITLDPQQSKTVEFTFRLDQLAFINTNGDWVIEKGDFSFFIGKNSRQDKTIIIDHRFRGFFEEAAEL
jgi:beta-glucosidase